MTSLLSQFAGVASQLNETNAIKKPNRVTEKAEGHRKRGGETRSSKVQEKYAEVFKDGNTIAKASSILGVSHVGCLNQVYRYEAKGLMHRGARDPDTGGIYFFWTMRNK